MTDTDRIVTLDDILAETVDQAILDGDVEELARLLLHLKGRHQTIADQVRAVEERLVEVMPDKVLEIPGLPVLERRTGKARTKWQSEDLFNAVLRVNGDIDDIRSCLPLTGSLGWRTTAVKALGIDPDEYCETAPGRSSIQVHGTIETAA